MKKIGYLVVFAVVLFFAGQFMGWWSLSSVEAADGKKGVSVQLSEGAKKQLAKAKEKVRGVWDKIKSKVTGAKAEKSQFVSGAIQSIDEDTIQIKVDGIADPVSIPALAAKMSLNGKDVAVGDLKAGDKIEFSKSGEDFILKATR